MNEVKKTNEAELSAAAVQGGESEERTARERLSLASITRAFGTAVVSVVFLTAVLGVLYPAVVTVVGGTLFPDQASGSLVRDESGKVIGSRLLGQDWTDTGLFEGRPSATGERPNNPMATSGTNYAQSNPELVKAVRERAERWRRLTGSDAPVPMELLTASSSGLDPQITREGALYQIPWVAKRTGLTPERLRTMIFECSSQEAAALGGGALVNVFELNMRVRAELVAAGKPAMPPALEKTPEKSRS